MWLRLVWSPSENRVWKKRNTIGRPIDFFETSLYWSKRRERENETVLDQWVQFSDQFMFGWDEVAPHVWEAPRARMAEMEATGNLPKETTRSQWASAQPAFILWEVERAFKHKVEGWVTKFSEVKQLPHGFSSIGMKLHYSLSWQDQASGCLKFKYPLQFMRSGLCLQANLNVP